MRTMIGVCLLLLVTGCGGKRPIEGTVTLDGAPLDKGSITFAKSGVREGAIIAAGKFRVELLEGAYDVEIHAAKVIGTKKEKYMNEWTDIEVRKEIKSEQKAEINASTRQLEFAIFDKK